MKLHKLHVRQNGARFISDGHAVASRYGRIGGLTVELAEAAGGQENRSCTHFVNRAIRFVQKTQAGDAAVLDNQSSGERVSAQMQMRQRMGAGEQGAADFAAGRVAVRVQNARTAMRSFAGEGELGA